MRGVKVLKTTRFDEFESVVEVIDENTDLEIRFIDVAGANSAEDLIRQFAAQANLMIICYAIN